MPRPKSLHLPLMLLSIGISIAWGLALGRNIPGGTLDFQNFYYGTKCLMQQCDPYNATALEQVYLSESGQRGLESGRLRTIIALFVNLPPVFLFVAPLAMLPWAAANALWLTIIGCGLLLAAYLMRHAGAAFSPGISTLLVCIVLSNSVLLFELGNAAGIVAPFCVIAAWCFLRNRFVPAAIVLFAVSLLIKPHDAGFIWLYFLLAGGMLRKRSLYSLAIATLLGVVSIIWLSHVAPHWLQELKLNLATISAHGGLNEPGAESQTGREVGMVVSLQAAFSVFRDDPRFYNAASYLVSGVLLLVWALKTMRTKLTQRGAWLALAAVSALSLLPVYHRSYDAKLLLLAVPACAMLWAERHRQRSFAFVLTLAAIVFTSDIFLAIFVILTNNLHFFTGSFAGQLATLLFLRPTPLILLAMGCFYLWVYVRYNPDESPAVARIDSPVTTT